MGFCAIALTAAAVWFFVFELTGLSEIHVLLRLKGATKSAFFALCIVRLTRTALTTAHFLRQTTVLTTSLKATKQRVKRFAFLAFYFCHTSTLLSSIGIKLS